VLKQKAKVTKKKESNVINATNAGKRAIEER